MAQLTTGTQADEDQLRLLVGYLAAVGCPDRVMAQRGRAPHTGAFTTALGAAVSVPPREDWVGQARVAVAPQLGGSRAGGRNVRARLAAVLDARLLEGPLLGLVREEGVAYWAPSQRVVRARVRRWVGRAAVGEREVEAGRVPEGARRRAEETKGEVAFEMTRDDMLMDLQ